MYDSDFIGTSYIKFNIHWRALYLRVTYRLLSILEILNRRNFLKQKTTTRRYIIRLDEAENQTDFKWREMLVYEFLIKFVDYLPFRATLKNNV